MSHVEFDYRLTGTGWAEASIRHGDASLLLTASYLGDALGNLLHAVEDLLAGAGSSRCAWEEEPGQYWWLFERTADVVRLRILWFDDWVAEPDDSGVLRFEGTVPLADLAMAIASGAEKVLAEYGVEGYLRRWVAAPFPEELLSGIQSRLSV